jgi:general nucleoside transport system ATP-binding protein
MHIALRDIHKHYGPIRANDGVCLEIAAGSIHGILGENGAGKSTLMKILAGYVRRNSGEIFLDGKAVDLGGPAEATRLGIGMLYQDPLDFPPLTVLESFKVAHRDGPASMAVGSRELVRWTKELEFPLDPGARVGDLTVGERQQLELVRLLALGVRLLILDEPTTGISAHQKEGLFRALRRLASEGRTIVLVSHKLDDVEALCHRVSVLRQGRIVGAMDRPLDAGSLLAWMFGALPSPPACRLDREPSSRMALEMKGVSATGGRAGLQRLSISIREGERVGLAGLEGSGQAVFLRVAAGLTRPRRGRVEVFAQDLTGRSNHRFQGAGVTFLPGARLEEGLIAGLTITEHVALRCSTGLRVPWVESEKMARERIERFRIRGTPSSKAESLSGGNQQRLLLALIPENPRLLLLENPTRGLDLESTQWVWQQLTQYARDGAAVVFSSADLDEIVRVADRVMIFFEGRLVLDAMTCETSSEQIVRAIAGKVAA